MSGPACSSGHPNLHSTCLHWDDPSPPHTHTSTFLMDCCIFARCDSRTNLELSSLAIRVFSRLAVIINVMHAHTCDEKRKAGLRQDAPTSDIAPRVKAATRGGADKARDRSYWVSSTTAPWQPNHHLPKELPPGRTRRMMVYAVLRLEGCAPAPMVIIPAHHASPRAARRTLDRGRCVEWWQGRAL